MDDWIKIINSMLDRLDPSKLYGFLKDIRSKKKRKELISDLFEIYVLLSDIYVDGLQVLSIVKEGETNQGSYIDSSSLYELVLSQARQLRRFSRLIKFNRHFLWLMDDNIYDHIFLISGTKLKLITALACAVQRELFINRKITLVSGACSTMLPPDEPTTTDSSVRSLVNDILEVSPQITIQLRAVGDSPFNDHPNTEFYEYVKLIDQQELSKNLGKINRCRTQLYNVIKQNFSLEEVLASIRSPSSLPNDFST